MAIHFVDEADQHGWISTDLDVVYDGPEDVEAYVEELFGDDTSFEEAAEELVIDLPNDLAIVEVRREDAPSHAFSS